MARGGSRKEDNSDKIIIFLLIIIAAVSAISLLNTLELKKSLVPQAINLDYFLQKLTAHGEMRNYVGVSPSNILQITNSNLATLQSQILGLDVSYVGSFIVQYNDAIVIYDYSKDMIRGTIALQPQQNISN
ncbi:hypothetical protein HYU09_02765 [Candidatus Woesearchaeota archaeon]|nr:hypothetical protein [Candidatus Woesearchaeota archaeon]